MAITDDLRKTLTDPTPLYALAGTADLAAEKLGEVPVLVERIRAEAPKHIEAVRATDPKDVQARVAQQAKEAQGKLNDLLGSLDTDLKKLREQAQVLALQGVGRAAEYAVRARETYDGLAERGRDAVQGWRGDAADHVEELAVVIEPDPAPKAAPKPAKANGTANGTANGRAAASRTGAVPKPVTKPATAKADGAKAAEAKSAKKDPARKPATRRSTPPSAK
ncbi:hypothetical protein [Streptomyces benahoarensis]|uniref:Heparin binding hemagglutinin HbhA n=1 Tax=Streptomyces benahoarensis TaxID=2595054 RepID=A0A553Z8L6_9ACTN|nr:hypothetical protein [Streptomyces benahoarensis]TSB12053.1 hypothetical protein FNJ62_30425 [Streptomyces benahoarensis]TSB37786.1 hypothetical protein FNZ23_18055 [Streptomyces benahoarensis]